MLGHYVFFDVTCFSHQVFCFSNYGDMCRRSSQWPLVTTFFIFVGVFFFVAGWNRGLLVRACFLCAPRRGTLSTRCILHCSFTALTEKVSLSCQYKRSARSHMDFTIFSSSVTVGLLNFTASMFTLKSSSVLSTHMSSVMATTGTLLDVGCMPFL